MYQTQDLSAPSAPDPPPAYEELALNQSDKVAPAYGSVTQAPPPNQQVPYEYSSSSHGGSQSQKIPPTYQYPPGSQPPYPPAGNQPPYPPAGNQPPYPPGNQPMYPSANQPLNPGNTRYASNQVVIGQPQNYGGAVDSSTANILISNYTGLSIFGCICCWITGIVAIVFSRRTAEAKKKGNYSDARRFSRTAMIMAIISIVMGIMIIIILIIVIPQLVLHVFAKPHHQDFLN